MALDNGAWADYTDEESRILDERMMMGDASFCMTGRKWLNYVVVLDASFEDTPGEHGEPSVHRMYQYNTQSFKKRKVRRIIVLMD